MVSHAYKFSGIVCRNKENPSIPLFQEEKTIQLLPSWKPER